MRSLLLRHASLVVIGTAITTMLVAGCGAPTPATAVAPKPAVAAPVQGQPATANAAPAAAKPTDAKSQSIFDTNDNTSECKALTAADIKAISGQDVHPIAHMQFANLVQCGHYQTANNREFLGVNLIESGSSYASELKSIKPDLYPTRVQLDGVGDGAFLFKATAGDSTMRYLIARKGDRGAILMPFGAAKDVTDDMLKQMLAKVVSQL